MKQLAYYRRHSVKMARTRRTAQMIRQLGDENLGLCRLRIHFFHRWQKYNIYPLALGKSHILVPVARITV
ncbi:hypothetical protein D3C77_623050 [compost metagenome]